MNLSTGLLQRVVTGLLLGLMAMSAAMARDVRLPDGTEVPVEVHPAAGELRLVWLPSGYASQRMEEPVARALSQTGIEVWQADVLQGRLLIPAESSLAQIPDSDITGLIDAARQDGKRVVLVASARAGIVALRGAHAWLDRHTGQAHALAGIILMHPNLYVGPPAPGREAEYHPVVAQTRVPVFIIQPEQSPWRWRLPATRAELEHGGAKVYTRLLTDVRDRYYFRPDATAGEVEATRRMADVLHDASRLLAATSMAPPPVAPVESSAPIRQPPGQRGLQPFRGNPEPAPLRLAGFESAAVTDLAALRGRVVLINFWASWCPPCVREMPSMQRLKARMKGRPFEILAVNMGEKDDEVRAFLNDKVAINFPVLMDRDGTVLKSWKVFVFPTSYVVDPQGRVRLGVFGEVEWDSPDVVSEIERLLPAP